MDRRGRQTSNRQRLTPFLNPSAEPLVHIACETCTRRSTYASARAEGWVFDLDRDHYLCVACQAPATDIVDQLLRTQ